MALSKVEEARLLYGWGHRRKDLRFYGVTEGRRSAEEAQGLLSFTWMSDRIGPVLNPPAAQVLARDKWVFARLMAGFGLPVPRTLGLQHPIWGVTWDGRRMNTAQRAAETLREAGLERVVLKPSNGEQGKGLVVVDEVLDDGARVRLRSGEETSLAEALARTTSAGPGHLAGALIQEVLQQHPVLDELAPWTVNTVRVATLLDLSGEVHVLAATTYLGRRGRDVSNGHAGGVKVGIDLDTGALGAAVVGELGTPVDAHPDSGQTFDGVVLPYWPQVLDTCARAAERLPGLRSIGWDVVLTPTGPVLLEANDGWGVKSVQFHGPGFLADPRTRAALEAAGAPLPSGSMWRSVPRRLRRQAEAVGRRLRRAH